MTHLPLAPDRRSSSIRRLGSNTRLGAALAALFVVVLGLNLIVASAGEQNGLLVFATFLAAAGALAGLVISTVAIVHRRDRSLLVFAPLAIGALVVVFLIVEIFVGHG